MKHASVSSDGKLLLQWDDVAQDLQLADVEAFWYSLLNTAASILQPDSSAHFEAPLDDGFMRLKLTRNDAVISEELLVFRSPVDNRSDRAGYPVLRARYTVKEFARTRLQMLSGVTTTPKNQRAFERLKKVISEKVIAEQGVGGNPLPRRESEIEP
jgi:hypothetical protein